MEITSLIKIDFDNMENRDARYEKEIAVFAGTAELSSHGVCAKYIQTLSPIRIYLGWDGKCYPQFKTITRSINMVNTNET